MQIMDDSTGILISSSDPQTLYQRTDFRFKKKGAVVGESGGIDSAVILTLCVEEL
jgi:NH3-dependent NAD+ synthetase